MKRLLALLPLLLATGCAQIAPGATPADPVDAATLGLAASPVQWPAANWWQRYEDPQLNRLVEQAVAGSPSLLAAQARVAQANAAAAQARADLLPSVSGNYGLTRQRYSGNYIYPPPLGGSVGTDNRLALDFSYEIDFWGKHRAEHEAALSRVQSAEAEARAAHNLLASAVVRSYLNLQNAFAQQQVIADTVRQREDVAQLTRDRQAAGLDTQVEVKQAESALAAAKVEAVQVQTRLAVGRNQLAALAGGGPELARGIQAAALRRLPLAVPDTLPIELLGHRPDVVAARWRAEAARKDIQSARAAFYPNVNLSAFLGFASLSTGNLLNAGSRMAGIGPAISLPIFEGGRLNAALAGRRAESDLAVADYNDTVLTAVHQVADAVDALRLLGDESQAQTQARAAVEEAYALALDRYRSGLGNYLSVLIAQDGVLQQRRQETDLRLRGYQLDADLAYALGGGYAPDAS
ncbi:Outer membrane component of tripartite multidrug resistance system [plant metagenome]|uniref:Outer membrane component of tripartite multidrug resistance system n=1 Tax=plant metagenome TaxID=1297885 RepID=A0A484RD42_9ZZZZ